jgi:hypothetical protein
MNKLKRLIYFVAGFAAVSLAITLGTETHAIAQAIRAALVRNQDEPGRNPYFETKDVICTRRDASRISPRCRRGSVWCSRLSVRNAVNTEPRLNR